MECKCGSQNIEGSKECWNCGEPLQAEKKRSTSSLAVWAVMLALAAILTFMVVGSGSGGSAGGGSSAVAGKTATQSVDPTSSAAQTDTASATTGTPKPKRK